MQVKDKANLKLVSQTPMRSVTLTKVNGSFGMGISNGKGGTVLFPPSLSATPPRATISWNVADGNDDTLLLVWCSGFA
jgi:hypothetical protein